MDNIKICQFMGAEVTQWYIQSKIYNQDGRMAEYPKDSPYPDNQKYHSVTLLKYHSSWNWLMPVVEKIESFNLTVTVKKITFTHSAVCEFIDWYNKTNERSLLLL